MKVLIPVAEGSEEMEAVICIDTLRRAGWQVDVAGLGEGVMTLSRGVRLAPDRAWEEIDPDAYDLMVIPGGGGGVDRMIEHAGLVAAIERHAKAGKPLASVCAGALVLQAAGVLEGRRVTCHPNAAPRLTATERVDERVVVDGALITSQGPGTCFEFALTLIEQLESPAKAGEVAGPMIVA